MELGSAVPGSLGACRPPEGQSSSRALESSVLLCHHLGHASHILGDLPSFSLPVMTVTRSGSERILTIVKKKMGKKIAEIRPITTLYSDYRDGPQVADCADLLGTQ